MHRLVVAYVRCYWSLNIAYTNKYVDFEDGCNHATIKAKLRYRLEERGNTRDGVRLSVRDHLHLITILCEFRRNDT